jgi:hypothetical protein
VTAVRYDFEGEQLTAAEVQRRVPALSESAVREHLRAGRNTREAMLTHRPKWAKPSDAVRFPMKVAKTAAHERRELRKTRK